MKIDSLAKTDKHHIHSVADLYNTGYDWLITKGPGIVIGIILLIAGLYVIKMLSNWLHRGMHKRNVDPSLKPFLLSLFIIAMRVVLVLGVMQFVGIQMTIFAALVGAFGVAAGLALSGTLQNFASGVLILLLKPFRVGDNIVTQGQEGTVKSIEIFYTIVTTFDNRTVVVPNSKLSNEIIVNISKEGSRRLDVSWKLNYGADLNHVTEIINKVTDDSKNILKTPARRIGVDKFEVDGYTISVAVWLKAHGFQDAKLDYQDKLLRAFQESDIELPGKPAPKKA